jgi:hypothetical protein
MTAPYARPNRYLAEHFPEVLAEERRFVQARTNETPWREAEQRLNAIGIRLRGDRTLRLDDVVADWGQYWRDVEAAQRHRNKE